MRASVKMRAVGPGGNLKILSRPQPELGIRAQKRNEAETGGRIGQKASGGLGFLC